VWSDEGFTTEITEATEKRGRFLAQRTRGFGADAEEK